ncbi:hypothetical protein M9Y10_009598 [Tritrichomonas musculus]|uniref:Ubiquitin-like domain-containing protein n=1 Tax=Tritrichomonas musculus TaxID=1915356 RepID=A0ABR2IP13_9EUKA
MYLYIKPLSGRYITILFEKTDSIKDIKAKIKEKAKIPTDQQLLIYNGKELEDEKTLEYYSINMNSTLDFIRFPMTQKVHKKHKKYLRMNYN